VALVLVESGMTVGPTVLDVIVLVVFDRDVLVLVDKSALVISHLDVAPGYHTEVPVDQMEPGHVYQADAVGGTENK